MLASPATTASSVTAGGGGPGSPIANLSALTVLNQSYVGNLSNGPEQIGAVTPVGGRAGRPCRTGRGPARHG